VKRSLLRRAAICLVLAAVVLALWAEGAPREVYAPAALAAAGLGGWILWSRGRSPRAPRWAAAFTAASLTLLAADLALRPLLQTKLAPDPVGRFLRPWPANPDLVRFAPNACFEGETSGDLAAMARRESPRELRRVRFVTDSLGFRNEPGALAEPVDVILLGDSFGVGAGTTQEETWAALLEGRWGHRVYNLSMPGGPWHEVLNLEYTLERLETRPGTVILWALFSGNDLDDAYGESLEPPAPRGALGRALVAYGSFRRRSPLRLLLRSPHGSRAEVIERALPRGEPVLFFGPYAERARRTPGDLHAHPNHPALRRVLARMRRLAAARGIGVAIIAIPSKAEVYSWLLEGREPWSARSEPTAFAAVLSSAAGEEGFRFLDLEPRLAEAARRLYELHGKSLWWRDDTHWNAEGHRVAAEAVAAELLGG
jgi:hypothetical protein